MFEQPKSVSGRSPTPKSPLHTAMHSFVYWLEQRENHYEVVFFDAHAPVTDLALRRRHLGMYFLRTSFVALATGSVRDGQLQSGRFVDTSLGLFTAVAEHSARQMADLVVYPTAYARIRDLDSRIKSKRIAIVPPPLAMPSKGVAARPRAVSGVAHDQTIVVIETGATTQLMIEQVVQATAGAVAQQWQ